MRIIRTLSASLFLAIAACGQAAAPSEAGAQTAAPASTELSAADRTAILASQNLRADARGLVENECGDRVEPQILQVDLGGDVGRAALLAMGGGPSMASCYGDGPGLTLLKREGANWRAIYSSRGGFMAIMPTRTRGVADIAFAGPGFDYPLHVWNGTTYVRADRSVGDAQLEGATFLPQ
ncbi:MAG: hypothetical protein A4S17_10010 [Proteobacteria bacterium HN_bin10]|nr:MAG: hypothetical protein A4S17_10010 [Proteobacteria bacterium HN_bin10]